jgi:hypothetical protein
MRSRTALALTAAGAVCLIAAPAAAQEALGVEAVLEFTPDFFATASPADAYEMILRLPGFILKEGGEDVRGYAGASGNVLVDGRPPAGKQEGLAILLRRIPFASVERIDLIRGGAPGIDMGGHAVIANIVRRRAGGMEASAESGISAAQREGAAPRIEAEVTRSWGDRRLEVAGAFTDEIDEDSGAGSIIVLRPGRGADQAPRNVSEGERVASLSGKYETPLARGELVANASLKREIGRLDTRTGGEAVRERERLVSGEFGGLFRRGIGGSSRLELLAVQRVGFLRALEVDSDALFRESSKTRETIARAALRREGKPITFDASFEGALNTLSSSARLEAEGVPLAVPGSRARVRERRAEAALGLSWTASNALLVEPSLRAEASTIRSSGDSPQRESFLFLKPRLALRYAPNKANQVRLLFEREVGQLDFGDFVASASLEQGQVSAGAIALRPPQTWRASAAFEHRFSSDGAIVASYSREWISDVVDRVLVEQGGERFDAVGNIGSGSRDILRVEASAELGRLLPHARISGSLTARWSRVTDPVTGETRPISEDDRLEGDMRFTQNLGAFTWGADVKLPERNRAYRFDEIRGEREALRLSLHAQYRTGPWHLRLELANLNRPLIVESRSEYGGPRSRAMLEKVETRRTRTTPIASLTLRRSFGDAASGDDAQAGSKP